LNRPSIDHLTHGQINATNHLAILCDFDDTAADCNVATLLLSAFAGEHSPGMTPGWQVIRQRFWDSEISLAEYQEKAFARLSQSKREQVSYVQANAKLRRGFHSLAEYCELNGIELAIVSHGLDYYVRALLEKEGLGRIPVFAVDTGISKTGEQTYSYKYTHAECQWTPGNCKCRLVEEYRERGHSIIYAGDGASDTCPAARADFVFARDSLLSFCQWQELPHRELTDFTVLLDYLVQRHREDA
jgi:2-hydroxy-3-keto-5-methylthiopentenyl-1-phosphate phosphatase